MKLNFKSYEIKNSFKIGFIYAIDRYDGLVFFFWTEHMGYPFIILLEMEQRYKLPE